MPTTATAIFIYISYIYILGGRQRTVYGVHKADSVHCTLYSVAWCRGDGEYTLNAVSPTSVVVGWWCRSGNGVVEEGYHGMVSIVLI